MKVCHFIASRGLGRGEFYIDLANELSDHCDVSLLVPKDARYLGRISSAISVYLYESRNSRNNPFLLWELIRTIRSIAPDIVHTHFGKATEMFFLINRLLRLPHVATKHNPRKGRIFDRLDHVIAVSERVRTTIRRGSAHVIHNAISPVDIVPRELRPDRFTLIAVGRLDPIKGFDFLLRDLAGLDLDFVLKIVGSGPEEDNLKRLIRELGLQERVELLGYREDIPRLLNEADVVVISSHSEGGPVVALEALFYGNLLISTPVGVVPEILPPELLVEHGDFYATVKKVCLDYGTFAKKFRQLKSTCQAGFLLSNIAKQHIEVYCDVFPGSTKSSPKEVG